MTRWGVRVAALWVVLVVAVPGPAAGQPRLWTEAPGATPAPELARFNQLLAGLAERALPALVYVRVRRAPAASQSSEDAPLEPRRTSGSGFVIDPGGLIVTNAHVVDGETSLQVKLADGRRLPARVVGRDRRVDLALIRVDGVEGLPVLPLGDSNALRVGEFVLALGHPFRLEQTVSFGIVSRKGAPLVSAAPGFDFIQTDAAINPGNSGGPLLNMAGEVVGVNSMAARNGSIGFAIPSNLVKRLVPELASKGRVEWGWLGVGIDEVTDEEMDRLKLPGPRGVLVRSVQPGEPADRGGLKADDVLVTLDGTPLDTPKDLQRIIATTPAGKRVRIVLVRAGQQQEVEVEVGAYRDPEPATPGPRRPAPAPPRPGH
jgi:serine protease Do